MSQQPRSLSPRIQRERLAEYLRQAREDMGWSQGVAAEQMEWSLSKLQRIETAVNSVSWTDTKALVECYGLADNAAAQQLLAMARQARKRDTFTPFKKYLTPEYQALLSYEESASDIHSVNSFVMPGLLQTPGHARALLSVKHTGDKLEALIKARGIRQRILDEDHGPHFEFVIDEAMLYRQIGGRDVHIEQLARLRELSSQPKLELRIIPFSADAHLGLWEPFMIMTIPGAPITNTRCETIVYRETGDTEYLIKTDDDRINDYRQSYAAIADQTMSQSQTRDLIDRVKHQLEAPEGASPNPVR
jgi:hypothetical protein